MRVKNNFVNSKSPQKTDALVKEFVKLNSTLPNIKGNQSSSPAGKGNNQLSNTTNLNIVNKMTVLSKMVSGTDKADDVGQISQLSAIIYMLGPLAKELLSIIESSISY